MRHLRVWIDYQPQIYTDLFKEILQSMGLADVLASTPAETGSKSSYLESESTDLIVLSLDKLGQLDLTWTPERLHNSRMVAFSPSGEFGLIRRSGTTSWEEIRPFGLKQLIELLSSERAG